MESVKQVITEKKSTITEILVPVIPFTEHSIRPVYISIDTLLDLVLENTMKHNTIKCLESCLKA
jgi:hypothetical protein